MAYVLIHLLIFSFFILISNYSVVVIFQRIAFAYQLLGLYVL